MIEQPPLYFEGAEPPPARWYHYVVSALIMSVSACLVLWCAFMFGL